MLKKILTAPAQLNALFLIRVIVGVWIIWYGKDVFISEWFEFRVISWKEDLGFSNPILMLYLSKGSELVFGFLLLLGLFTRLASFILLIVMTVAVFIGQNGQILPYEKGEITFFYWLFFLVFLFIGGGKYSLDFIIFKKDKEFI